ncbi:MAG: ribose-5-phosphate isomerase RpiA [Spirochaetales bacterium]
MSSDQTKRLVGYAAVDRYVRSGMKIGMGTGSTAVWAIRRIGELLANGTLTDIVGVPTSSQSELECHRLGIPLRSMNDPQVDGKLDLTIDGADEIDPQRNLTKGGGGALLLEKIVAYSSTGVVIVADERKLVSQLGKTFPVPLEVLPAARVPVMNALTKLGGEPVVRLAERKMGAVITDNGNIIIDVRFGEPFDAPEMEARLATVPGIVGNGLFCRIEPTVLVAYEDGRTEEFAG